MEKFRWDIAKNEKLKKDRGISFEELIEAELITARKHPSRDNQRILLFEYNKYIWVVPCIVEKGYFFLKTAFPSRKYTKKYKK